MKISTDAHLEQPWIAHQLLHDFRIEDVWQLPIHVQKENTTKEVLDTFVLAIGQIGKRGVAGLLFKLRNWMGRVFHWEDSPESKAPLKAGLLRTRFAKLEGLDPDDLPKGGFENFHLVYDLANETLLEIENKTVQAALHFGKVETINGSTVHMTICVKPNGTFGQLYMLAIKPFRHWIVYPTLLKALGRAWKSTK
ncbi:MAG: DUF2867 domain-containing protein [Reichenbachiella sp.]|uniref:DUF2867 domain-containing protein n=1 Tax=Reichenbachiella sp. TaxID=2184521 RepID=UPI0032654FA3